MFVLEISWAKKGSNINVFVSCCQFLFLRILSRLFQVKKGCWLSAGYTAGQNDARKLHRSDVEEARWFIHLWSNWYWSSLYWRVPYGTTLIWVHSWFLRQKVKYEKCCAMLYRWWNFYKRSGTVPMSTKIGFNEQLMWSKKFKGRESIRHFSSICLSSMMQSSPRVPRLPLQHYRSQLEQSQTSSCCIRFRPQSLSLQSITTPVGRFCVPLNRDSEQCFVSLPLWWEMLTNICIID